MPLRLDKLPHRLLQRRNVRQPCDCQSMRIRRSPVRQLQHDARQQLWLDRLQMWHGFVMHRRLALSQQPVCMRFGFVPIGLLQRDRLPLTRDRVAVWYRRRHLYGV